MYFQLTEVIGENVRHRKRFTIRRQVTMAKAKMLLIVLSVLACGAGTTLADDGIGFELTADYFGKYLWRGQDLNDDGVFQPGLSASYGGLTAGIWGSLELTDYTNNENQFTELDYSVDYSGDFPGLSGVSYSVGLIYYDFPSTVVKDTTELYWGLGFDLPLSPSITFYHDIDEAEGTYASFGLGHSVDQIAELSPGVPIGMEIGASFGWGSGSYNNYYWGINDSKMNDLTLGVSFPFEVAGMTVTPSFNYVTLLNDDIKATDTYRQESDYFFFGIGLVKEF